MPNKEPKRDKSRRPTSFPVDVPPQADPAFRPATPEEGLSVRLRRSIAVREEVLDWVPEERGRYTRLGAIVVNTAVLAAASFLLALQSINTSAAWLLLVPVAVFWGFVVYTLDSWLIASTHGGTGMSKLLVFAPRLIVSVLFGLVIAEPLVMTIFGAEIEQQIAETRGDEIASYEAQLTRCNPTTGIPVGDPGCAGLLITVTNTPFAARTELQTLIRERDAAVAEMKPLSTELEKLNTRAVNECAGTSGAGLSGVPGEGPECTYNREAVAAFRQENDIAQRQRNIVELNDEITRKSGKVAEADTAYAGEITAAIVARVADRRDSHNATGLLEQIKALHTLADENTAVLLAQWLLRLLLLAIDCLPVLAKLLNGSTAYDQQVNRQIAAGSELHERRITLRTREASVDAEVAMHDLETNRQERIDQIDEAARERRAQREITKRRQIASLAEDLRRGGLAG